jgi:stearoyl-CoA desaturase (delta-9 desaturase)
MSQDPRPSRVVAASIPLPRPSRARELGLAFVRWFDSWAGMEDHKVVKPRRVDLVRVVPFALLHLACLFVLLVGWSWTAVGVAVALYFVRMFAITAFYHRYFSHKSFKTSRFMQFVFAVVGNSAVQRGPLWWAAHHRHHHAFSDGEEDPHSPMRKGFFWAHIGWITDRGNFRTRIERVKDLARFPELRFLDRFDIVVPLLLFASLYGLGAAAAAWAPGLGTTGMQLVVWGLISTIVLGHATFTINSLAHLFGSRPYETTDTSRNNPFLALLTLGEGWHNNHHHYQASARQGFLWWEVDLSYYGLVCLKKLGLVWDLKPVPVRVLERRRPRGMRG